MIIGIDASRALRPRQTGTERYALEIIRHLLALPVASEHTWRLYTDGPAEPSTFCTRADPAADPAADKSGVALELCLLTARHMWTHRALAREVVQRPPDVLFIPAHVAPFVVPVWRLPPTVVTIHDLGYRYFPATHTWRQRLTWTGARNGVCSQRPG